VVSASPAAGLSNSPEESSLNGSFSVLSESSWTLPSAGMSSIDAVPSSPEALPSSELIPSSSVAVASVDSSASTSPG